MKKKYTLIGCGYFSEKHRPTLYRELLSLEVKVHHHEAVGWTDLNLYEKEVPARYPDIRMISRDFWDQFSQDVDYYTALVERSDVVRALAEVRSPDHKPVVNLLSDLCTTCGTRFEIFLM